MRLVEISPLGIVWKPSTDVVAIDDAVTVKALRFIQPRQRGYQRQGRPFSHRLLPHGSGSALPLLAEYEHPSRNRPAPSGARPIALAPYESGAGTDRPPIRFSGRRLFLPSLSESFKTNTYPIPPCEKEFNLTISPFRIRVDAPFVSR